MISLPVIRNKQIQISYCSEYILMMFDIFKSILEQGRKCLMPRNVPPNKQDEASLP